MVEIWTAGHSDRTVEEFLALLQAARIELVLDVRSAPWSRRHPWTSKPDLERNLEAAGIEYRWSGAALGGLEQFEERRGGAEYRRALENVIELARGRRVALVCAERDPRHCHRQLIADDLAHRGVVVRHLIDPGFTESQQTPLAFD